MFNQVKIGAILSYVSIFITLVIGFIYTPILLNMLGKSEYGLYSLAATLLAYLNILDMGLGNTIIRYLSENRVTGDKEKESIYNGFFLILYIIIGLMTLLIGIVINSYIDDLFSNTLTLEELDKFHSMVLIIVVSLACSFPLSVFTSIINAYEKFMYIKTINIVQTILNPLIAIPFLIAGYGSIMVITISCLLNILGLIFNLYYCITKLHIKFLFRKLKIKLVKEMLVYSFFIFLNYIMDKVYWNSGQFILGIISGTVYVAIYALAMQFMNVYIKLSIALSGVLLPKITMMVSEENINTNRLSMLMIKIGRLQYIIVAYILFMFIILGKEFLFLWVGNEYYEVYPIVIILMLGMFVPLIQNTGILILQALNLNKYRMTVYTCIAIIDFLVSFPMAKYFDGIGCAITTALALFISAGLIINRYYYKKINLNILLFWKNIVKMTRPLIALSMIIFIIKANIIIIVSWKSFIIESSLLTLLYLFTMNRYAFNEYERSLLVNTFNIVRKIKI